MPVSSEGERALIRRDNRRNVSTSEGMVVTTSGPVVVTTSGPVTVSVTSVELIPVERVPAQSQVQAQSRIQPLAFEHREMGLSA